MSSTLIVVRFFSFQFSVLFVLIWISSTNISESRKINTGTFLGYAHRVRSGIVTLLDNKRILIQSFYYDGLGPDAWFSIGQRNETCTNLPVPKERDDLTSNIKIPDENGSCKVVKRYSGSNIILTLPDGISFQNVDYIALYCYKYMHNFGYVKIPSNLVGLNMNYNYNNASTSSSFVPVSPCN